MPELDVDGHARAALREVSRDYGPAGLDDLRLMGAILPDLLATSPREMHLLMAATRVGTARLLRVRLDQRMPVEAAVRDVAALLAEDSLIDQSVCRWVVGEYATVLGHTATSEPATSEPATSEPATAKPHATAPAAAATPTAAAATAVAPTAMTAGSGSSDGEPAIDVVAPRTAWAVPGFANLIAGAFLVSFGLDVAGSNYSFYEGFAKRGIGLGLLVLPGCLLVGSAFGFLARALGRDGIRVDSAGVHRLSGDPRRRAAVRSTGWLLDGVLMVIVFAGFATGYDSASQLAGLVFLALVPGILFLVAGAWVLWRSRAAHAYWLTVFLRSRAAPGKPVVLETHAWSAISAIAVQPVGRIRRTAVVIRRVDTGDTFAAWRLGQSGARPRDVVTALREHGEQRLVPQLP